MWAQHNYLTQYLPQCGFLLVNLVFGLVWVLFLRSVSRHLLHLISPAAIPSTSSLVRRPTNLTMAPVSIRPPASPAKRLKMSEAGDSNLSSHSSGIFSEAAKLEIKRTAASKCFACQSTPVEAAYLIARNDSSVSCCPVVEQDYIPVLIIGELDRCLAWFLHQW